MRYVRTWDNDGNAPAGWESHVPLLWRDFEPRAGAYRFDRLDAWLAAAARPCHLGLVFYMHDYVDHTPAPHRATLQVTGSDGSRGEVPGYHNPAWRQAYYAAVRALADRYRDHAQVASFWLALGLDQETTATDPKFKDSLLSQMSAQSYYEFILEATAEAVAAWAPIPVYIEGAPAPGEAFGGAARFITARALASGAGYKMNGLTIDQADAIGLGSEAGQQKLDLAQHTNPRRLAYEAPDFGTNQPAGEMYWRLLRALAHDADFVAVQADWAPQVLVVQARLPDPAAAWLVFRQAEYPAQWWGAGGVSGEPGVWARGLTLLSAGEWQFQASVGEDRWLFTATEPLRLAVADPTWQRVAVTLYHGATTETLSWEVVKGQLILPVGVYHRVDVLPLPVLDPQAQIAALTARLTQLETQVAGLTAWRAAIAAASHA